MVRELYYSYCDWKERRLLYKMYKKLFAETFKDSDKRIIAFDIGANVGQYTRVLRKLDCFIVAIEPLKEVAQNIEDRFKGDTSVIVYNYAIGEKGEVISEKKIFKDFYIGEHSTHSTLIKNNSPLFKDMKYKGKIDVQMVSLKSLIDYEGTPDYIKIDTEGYEYGVLLTLDKPVKLISFEFSGNFKQLIKIINKLESLGEYEYNFESGDIKRWLVLRDKWVDRITLMSLLESLNVNMGDIFCRKI